MRVASLGEKVYNFCAWLHQSEMDNWNCENKCNIMSKNKVNKRILPSKAERKHRKIKCVICWKIIGINNSKEHMKRHTSDEIDNVQ
jgi:hypothetical protein